MPNVDIFPISVTKEPTARDYIDMWLCERFEKNMIMLKEMEPIILYDQILRKTLIYKYSTD